jgi:hypothetical protein
MPLVRDLSEAGFGMAGFVVGMIIYTGYVIYCEMHTTLI